MRTEGDTGLMGSVRWRAAAAAWLITLAAVGVGIAIYGRPGDGTHHDYCADGVQIAPVTSQVLLTDQENVPVVHIHIGESFTVQVNGGASPVAEPSVTHRGVVCQATRSSPARHLTVIFVGTHAGTTRLVSYHQLSSGGAGASGGLFTAAVVVGPVA
jgi:hypothetical protein